MSDPTTDPTTAASAPSNGHLQEDDLTIPKARVILDTEAAGADEPVDGGVAGSRPVAAEADSTVESAEGPDTPITLGQGGGGATGFTDQLASMAGVVLDPPHPGMANPSPDGTRVAFLQVDTDGIRKVWIAPIDGSDGGHPVALGLDIVPLDEPGGPQWSPDGAQLAITAPHPADGRSAIWLVTLDDGGGGMVRMLVDHPAIDSAPRWSKDGAWIGFIARRADRAAASIVRSDWLGVPIQVSHGPAGMDDHDLTWGHDGNRLAFARNVVDGDKRGDHIFTYNMVTGETKQITTRINGRHSLHWSPDRAQIAHVSDDAEWNHIAVVNADNNAGWNLASEAGDKSQPRWSTDGQRFVYVRTMDGVARCCERASSSSTAELCDPGDGTVSAPRLLPDKRVLYAFNPATGPTRLIVQQPKADAERTELPLAVGWETDRELITPHHLELEINGRRTGALRYQTPETEGAVPVVIVLRDRPDQPRTARLDLLEQALAAHRVIVVVPTLVGSPGYGSKLSGALAELTGSEAEVLDLLGLIDAVKSIGGVDRGRIAVVGEGAGGTLALLLAGSRPGTVQAVAAIDPVCDWNIELDSGDEATRTWMLRTYGLPATSPGVYALRTPSTFAGVVDAPLMLVGTDRVSSARAAQLDALTGLLRDLEIDFEQDVALTEPSWQTYRRVSTFIVDHLRAAASDPAPTGEATTPDAV